MKLLFPIFSLGVAVFAILWTPWPTAKDLWSPHSRKILQDTVQWLDPLARANYPATQMNFDDFCRRARYFATVSKQAHFVTQLNGMYQVTAEPQYTDQILYTARPLTPSDSKND